jgi:hypothetical protein
MMVRIWPLGIVLPIWLETIGVALWSLVAFKNGWLPEVGHLSHFGGLLHCSEKLSDTGLLRYRDEEFGPH